MSKKGSKESKLPIRYLKAPINFLIKTKNICIKGMAECSDRIGAYGMVMGCPTVTGQVANSSVSNRDDHDLRKLIRAASTRSLGNRVQPEIFPNGRINGANNNNNNNNMARRTRSVGIGRIAEDEPCEFEEDYNVNTDHVFTRRSRSYDVTKRKGFFY